MRILLIHSFYRPGLPSGENDVVLSQLDLLRKRGHDVELWSRTSPDEAGSADQLRIGLRVAAGRGSDPRPFIRGFKPDVIHVHNLFPNISLKWLSHGDSPIAMSIHNYRSVCANGVFIRDARPCTDCLAGSVKSALLHGCYRNSRTATIPVLGFQRHLRAAIAESVDALIFTSELSREVLSSRFADGYSIVLPNFVADVGASGVTLGPSEPEYFVVLGRLTPEKGIAQLLSIWPESKRLVIVGDGPQRSELERMAATSTVEFTGFVESKLRDEILVNARGLILPSLTLEADPVVVAQALSAGTPCVVNAHTASARHAPVSRAVRSYGDAESLRAALSGLDEGGIGEAARDLYLKTWSAEAWLRSYENRVLQYVAPQ